MATLRHLDNVQTSAVHPEEIEVALWFHDAIYAPYSSENEADSAKWATDFLSENSVSTVIINRVGNLILATQHSVELIENDEKLMVDIDLSILGCPEKDYSLFELNIRKEYKWVPAFIYKKKRKQILQSFIERDRIYSNDYFYTKFELQARNNIAKAMLNL